MLNFMRKYGLTQHANDEPLTKDTLNARCPFSYFSTKHFSAAGRAPDIESAKNANILIKRALDEFSRRIALSPRTWGAIPLADFSLAAKKSAELHNNMPSSFEEIFPIPLERNGQSIIESLEKNSNKLNDALCRLHACEYTKNGSHAKTARCVIAKLKKELIGTHQSNEAEVPSSDLKIISDEVCQNPEALLVPNEPDLSPGAPIDASVHETLVTYQSMQERFENPLQVDQTNKLIRHRPDLLETILGIQWELCAHLDQWAKDDPSLHGYSRAFSEIGIFAENSETVIPSSRFMKVILHNWGPYFLEVPELSSREMLLHAIDRALEDEVYLQNVFVFRTHKKRIKIHGIVPIVCPARSSLGRLIRHYIENVSERVLQGDQ